LTLKVNKEIRAPKVRVVTEEGDQLGILNIKEALEKAEQMGKDLVEIASNATPPVCKIIDFGKFRYQQTKKEKESKKSQHQVKIKEIKLRPNIDIHDLKTKIGHAREFLQKGNKVRIICTFKGRQMLHIDLGSKVMDNFIEELKDVSSVEAPSKLLGRNLTAVIAPIGKVIKKSVEKVVEKKEITSAENEDK
jgi:translation initiation factor IF-3